MELQIDLIAVVSPGAELEGAFVNLEGPKCKVQAAIAVEYRRRHPQHITGLVGDAVRVSVMLHPVAGASIIISAHSSFHLN